jgi:hypothetical protein
MRHEEDPMDDQPEERDPLKDAQPVPPRMLSFGTSVVSE